MKIGFIGAGNMGGAIIRGYTAGKAGMAAGQDDLFVFDSDTEKAMAFAGAGAPVVTADSLAQLAGLCDALVLCVKPNVMDEILDELAGLGVGAGAGETGGTGGTGETVGTDQNSGRLIISIAAGISINDIREKLGQRTRVVRVMPNTPAMVGEGMSVMSAADGTPDTDLRAAEKLFGAIGRAVWAPERLMDIVTGISGSSPAYAYLYIEGLIRAGVEGGLSEETATIMAAQSTLGAAKMVLENIGITDPRQLCANVCSPGGATIEAVKVLEAEGFIETVSKAAQASAAKSRLMSQH